MSDQVSLLVEVCAGGDALPNKASSFLVVEIQSHKSVTGRFPTCLRQHRSGLSLPSQHKRPPVSCAGRDETRNLSGDEQSPAHLFSSNIHSLYLQTETVQPIEHVEEHKNT